MAVSVSLVSFRTAALPLNDTEAGLVTRAFAAPSRDRPEVQYQVRTTNLVEVSTVVVLAGCCVSDPLRSGPLTNLATIGWYVLVCVCMCSFSLCSGSLARLTLRMA